MLVSEKGTVLDVAMSTNKHEATDKTTVPIMAVILKIMVRLILVEEFHIMILLMKLQLEQ